MGFELVKAEVDAVKASANVAEKLRTVEQVQALGQRAQALLDACAAFVAEATPPLEREINKFLAEVTAAGSDKNLKATAVDKFVAELGKL